MSRTFLTGATVVLADRVAPHHTVVVEDDAIVDVVPDGASGPPAERVALDGHLLVPGFVDAHVHGVAGVDVLEGADAVDRVAAQLPRWGVTSFCPTSIACPAATLAAFLAEVTEARVSPRPGSARVIAAHLESNFLSPQYHGAQPRECVCAGTDAMAGDLLGVIDRAGASVGIVTIAPEIPGGLDLVRRFVGAGRLVSIGHSNATFDEARAAIHAGASRATHLFNAMRPFHHQDPGIIGAVLTHDQVHVELICDTVHVHPAAMRLAIAAKTPERVLAITDGTAAAGQPTGTRARLGPHVITAADVARLDTGAMAGSVLTMDRAFANLVQHAHVDLVDAVRMCARTPALDLKHPRLGVIAPGALADLVVLTPAFEVAQTWVGGRKAR
jgi:N-acetylglucosamine-6-phosphate deacetylase